MRRHEALNCITGMRKALSKPTVSSRAPSKTCRKNGRPWDGQLTIVSPVTDSMGFICRYCTKIRRRFFFVEYCKLSRMTIYDTYIILGLGKCLQSLNDAKMFTKMDDSPGYEQIPLTADDFCRHPSHVMWRRVHFADSHLSWITRPQELSICWTFFYRKIDGEAAQYK